MTEDLAAWATERGVKHFMVSFTDLFGAQRAKLVPREAIRGMQEEGAGFAAFATWLDYTAAAPDLMAVPDAASAVQLPWRPEVAWVAATATMEGEEVAQAPRNVLRRVLADAAKDGLTVRTGVEPEFFLLTPDGRAASDAADVAEKPCYDQQAVMRRYDVVAELMDHMTAMGWAPYQADHEDAIGQFEMNWLYADALTTADRHSFFKFMARSVAEAHGFRATFMPKPFEHLTGSGCHVHLSAWEGERNAFADDAAELGLSDRGRAFVGGLLAHAPALAAITNPTVNSYKRLNAPRTASGATWAPATVTWTGNNRTHMIRVPGPGRFELRLPDGAANPYLMQAAIVAAGLDGMRSGADPGPRLDIDMYIDGHTVADAPRLPLNLLDALRALEGDATLRAALGEAAVASYLKLRRREWDGYAAHLTEWERVATLDC